MAPTIEVSCRVDYRANSTDRFSEHTSRLDSLSATGCTIRSRALPDTDMLELRIYLPDGEWPLGIDRAKVTWIHWDGFTAEFFGDAGCGSTPIGRVPLGRESAPSGLRYHVRP